MEPKTASTAYPIHELANRRWSPVAFGDRPVARETVGSLVEAARWAASCFNEQPWAFFVAHREDSATFEKLASCLVPGNDWAKSAPVLMLSVASGTFARNDKPNRHAWHDVGLATGQLMLEAVAHGLHTHAMAGFDAEHAVKTLGIPDGWDPVAMLAVGYHDVTDKTPEQLKQRDAASRARKDLGSFVFGAQWGQAAL